MLDWIPDSLVRIFAAPYVAGDRLEDGLAVAHELRSSSNIATTLDLLAEEVGSEERVGENLQAYLDLIDGVGRDPRFADPTTRPSVSVKLSSFTLDPLEHGGKASGCREAMLQVAARARDVGVALTIDMESRHWTDFTLDIATELFLSGHDIGTVLQSRLHRTNEDIERLPAQMRIRMVIGIYPEPKAVALTDKRAMKERMLEQCDRLLEREMYVEYASHDQEFVKRFLNGVESRGIDGDRYEVQMLFGVPRARLLCDIRDGRWTKHTPPKVRLYLPYATAWDQATAYCRRRLKSNPTLGLYVAQNLLSSLRGHRPGLHQYLEHRANNTAESAPP